MSRREQLDPRTSLWDLIAHELRIRRERTGLTGTQLGDRIGCVRSTVSRLESGALRLDLKQAVLVDKALETGGLFGFLGAHALREQRQQWSEAHRDIEAAASAIKIFEAAVVPGLLQSPEYTRALVLSGGVTEEAAHAEVERRARRQEILTREDPPLLWAILAETVLEWPVGGPETMREQLAYLLKAADAPNIAIRVVPKRTGAYIGLDGSFKIISGPAGDVASLEAPEGGCLIFSLEARSYLERYDRIGIKALPDSQSKELIREKLETYQ